MNNPLYLLVEFFINPVTAGAITITIGGTLITTIIGVLSAKTSKIKDSGLSDILFVTAFLCALATGILVIAFLIWAPKG